MKTFHNFVLPIYSEPSRRFKTFMEMISQPVVTASVTGTYWQNRLTLTYFDGCSKHTGSIIPFTDAFSKSRRSEFNRLISIFTSKLNCSMSLVDKDCEICINLSKSSENDKLMYGKDVLYVIQVKVSCNSMAKEIALNNLFLVVDASPRNVGKSDISGQ